METLRDLYVLEKIQEQRLEEMRREAKQAALLRELNPGKPNRLPLLLGILFLLFPLVIWVATTVAS